MSKLENAIIAIEEVFVEFAGTDENKKTLSNAELSALLKAQLSNPDFKCKLDQEDVSESLDNIDKNHDDQVNFKEFSNCVANIAQSYYKKKHGKDKGCKGKKK